MRKRSFLLGDSIYKLNLWRPSLEIRKRSLILSDTIFKLNLNVKAVKAAFLDEKEKFTSWWFNFQVEYWFSSWLWFGRLQRPSFQMRKRSLLLGDWISKLNLNLKAVKAEFVTSCVWGEVNFAFENLGADFQFWREEEREVELKFRFLL